MLKRVGYYTELIAYLATREHGATAEQLADTFGLQVATARTQVKTARDWLGVNPRTGDKHLPDAMKSKASQARGIGVYQIDDILVDADLFKRLRARGSARGGDAGIADLEAALSLVTGEPFSQLRPGGYEWLTDTALDQHLVPTITAVAHIVATYALEKGEPERAAAAAQIALLAGPYEDQPRVDLAAAHEALTSRADAERYLRDEICNRPDDDGAPPELSERTAEIIRRRQWLSPAG